jgi:transposase
MPPFCRLLPGSVPDVVTLEATARILRALGLKDSEFVLDRGFYSNSNLRDLLLGGHHFTIGALLACRQSREPFRRASLAQGLQLINRYRRSLNSPKRSIFHEGRTVRHVQDRWIVDMGRDGRGKRREGQAVEAHIFFDPRRHADRVAQLDERVFALEEKAASEHFADRAEAGRWLTENASDRGGLRREPPTRGSRS